MFDVILKYCKPLFATIRLVAVGVGLKLPSVETVKVRSGLVAIITYINFSIIDMYVVFQSLSNCKLLEVEVDNYDDIADAATSFALLSRGIFILLQDIMINILSVF